MICSRVRAIGRPDIPYRVNALAAFTQLFDSGTMSGASVFNRRRGALSDLFRPGG